MCNSFMSGAQQKVCDGIIDKEMGPITEALQKIVDETCKPMKHKSAAAGDCCDKAGSEVVDSTIGDETEEQTTACLELKTASEVAPKMKELGEAAMNDLPDKFKGSLGSLQDCATDAATDAAGDAAGDAVKRFDQTSPLLFARASIPAGSMLLLGAAVASAVLVLGRRRMRSASALALEVTEATEVEAPSGAELDIGQA